jgi:hypothetical protein
MIIFMRTASIAPGKVMDALSFGHTIAKYIADRHGVKAQVFIPIGGNPNRIGWQVQFAALAEWDDLTVNLLLDPEYAKLIAANSQNLLPGSVHDEFWRQV